MIIKKIEDLFPVLEEMTGQNDAKASHVVNKLLGLKQALDEACREMENEIDRNGN